MLSDILFPMIHSILMEILFITCDIYGFAIISVHSLFLASFISFVVVVVVVVIGVHRCFIIIVVVALVVVIVVIIIDALILLQIFVLANISINVCQVHSSQFYISNFSIALMTCCSY